MLHRRLTPLPFLASLETAPGPDPRRILLRIATDHFISLQNPSPPQIAHFEKTVERLIGKADPATRLLVAAKLAVHPTAPPRVFEMIETMGGEGALHILEHAPLPRERLLAAALGNESRASALARRGDLDADIVATLSARPEVEVVLALAGNPAAPIGAAAFATQARRAEREKPLAAALLGRPTGEIDPAALFLIASSEQRAAILAAAQRAEIAARGRRSLSKRRRRGDCAARKLRARAGARTVQRNPRAGARMQPRSCRADRWRDLGRTLAVALAALGAAQDVAVRILISGDLQSGARYTRVGSLIRLKDGLNPAAARRVIAALIGAPRPRPHRQHQPVLDPNASSAPEPRGAPQTRRAASRATRTRPASASSPMRRRAA